MRQGRAAGARGRTAVRGVVVWGLVLAIAGVGALPGVPLGRVPLEGCGGGRRCVENRGLGCASEGRTFGGCPSGGGVAGMMHERAQGIRGPLRGGAADVGGAGGDSGAGKKDDGAVRRFGFGGRVPSLQGFHRKFDKKKKKAGKSFAVREVRPCSARPPRERIRRRFLIHRPGRLLASLPGESDPRPGIFSQSRGGHHSHEPR